MKSSPASVAATPGSLVAVTQVRSSGMSGGRCGVATEPRGARPHGRGPLPSFARVAVMLIPLVQVAGPPCAHAYRTFADDPAVAFAASWGSPELPWEVSSAELDEQRVRADTLAGALEAALRTCRSTGCAPVLSVVGTTSEPAAPGDGRNTIGVVATDWIGRGFPSGRGLVMEILTP